jgi:hypothetical protein
MRFTSSALCRALREFSRARLWSVVILSLAVLAGCDLITAGVKSSYTSERANVEQVLQTESDGYRFVAYVVTWKDARVVVSDPLARSHHREGDEIRFLAQRIALPGGPKELSFTLTEP